MRSAGGLAIASSPSAQKAPSSGVRDPFPMKGGSTRARLAARSGYFAAKARAADAPAENPTRWTFCWPASSATRLMPSTSASKV